MGRYLIFLVKSPHLANAIMGRLDSRPLIKAGVDNVVIVGYNGIVPVLLVDLLWSQLKRFM